MRQPAGDHRSGVQRHLDSAQFSVETRLPNDPFRKAEEIRACEERDKRHFLHGSTHHDIVMDEALGVAEGLGLGLDHAVQGGARKPGIEGTHVPRSVVSGRQSRRKLIASPLSKDQPDRKKGRRPCLHSDTKIDQSNVCHVGEDRVRRGLGNRRRIEGKCVRLMSDANEGGWIRSATRGEAGKNESQARDEDPRRSAFRRGHEAATSSSRPTPQAGLDRRLGARIQSLVVFRRSDLQRRVEGSGAPSW